MGMERDLTWFSLHPVSKNFSACPTPLTTTLFEFLILLQGFEEGITEAQEGRYAKLVKLGKA